MYFNLSAEAVARYWLSKGFFDSKNDALRVATSIFEEARGADPRAELYGFISKSVENGRAEPGDLERVSKAFDSGDWQQIANVLGRINLIDQLNKSVVPSYGIAMTFADEAKYRQGISSQELLKLDYLLKERVRISELAKSQPGEKNDFMANRLGAAELEAQDIWTKIVTTVRG